MDDEGFAGSSPTRILEPPALLRRFPQPPARESGARMNPIDLAIIVVYVVGCTALGAWLGAGRG